MLSLLRKARTLAPPMDIQLQLFHTPVTPVVMYGAEAWEIEDYTVIERLHLKFCKYILSLSKMYIHKYGIHWYIYSETAEIPLSSRVKCRIIVKYWSGLIRLRSCHLLFTSLYIVYTRIISTTLRGYYLLRKYYVIVVDRGSGKVKLFPLEYASLTIIFYSASEINLYSNGTPTLIIAQNPLTSECSN